MAEPMKFVRSNDPLFEIALQEAIKVYEHLGSEMPERDTPIDLGFLPQETLDSAGDIPAFHLLEELLQAADHPDRSKGT